MRLAEKLDWKGLISFRLLEGTKKASRTLPLNLLSDSGLTFIRNEDYLLVVVGSVANICSIRGMKFPYQRSNCQFFKEKSMIHTSIAPIYRVTKNASTFVAHKHTVRSLSSVIS
jgi:hypothetical protein